MNKIKDKDRLLWADVMKGIGIISVVIGHVYGGGIHKLIFSYHMPLFFFIGGYFFKPNGSLFYYFKKQSKSLLVPYLSFLTLIYLVFYLPDLIRNSNLENLLGFVFRPLLGGKWLVSYASVFWFITCYFLTQQTANYLFIKYSDKKLLIIGSVFLFLSYINSIYLKDLWVPWNLNVVFAAFPFFLLGFMYSKSKFVIKDTVLLIISCISIFLVFALDDNTYDMKYSEYGIPLLTFFCSLVLIVFIKRISEIISINRYSQFIGQLGKASLVIMYGHQPLQIVLRSYFLDNKFIISFLSITLSFFLYKVLSSNESTKFFFLGIKTRKS